MQRNEIPAFIASRLRDVASFNGCVGTRDGICCQLSPDDPVEWCKYCVQGEAAKIIDTALRACAEAGDTPADGEDYEQPQRTLDIIARMLGWMNTPPRRVFEQEINALKSRACAEAPAPKEGKVQDGQSRSETPEISQPLQSSATTAGDITTPAPENTAWLVGLGSMPPQWWTGRGHEFTDAVDGTQRNPACSAMRFARREDAERAIGWLVKEGTRDGCRAEEHIWL